MTLYECVLPSSTGFHFNNYYFEQNKTRQHKQHSANKTLLRRDQMNIEPKIVWFGSSFELVCVTFYNMYVRKTISYIWKNFKELKRFDENIYHLDD